MSAEQIAEIPAGFLEVAGKMMDLVMYRVWEVLVDNQDKTPAEVLHITEREVGTWLARKFFESQYGGPMQSYVEVGQVRTQARAKECNKIAGSYLWTALQIAREMNAEDVRQLATRVRELVDQEGRN